MMNLKVCLFFIMSVLVASCVDLPEFNDTPKIYYNSIDHYPDTNSLGNKVEKIIISIDFEDGNGDLGASEAERNNSVKYADGKGNYELITCTFENNMWVERFSSLDHNKFFPELKPDGKSAPIKGKLDLNTEAPFSNSANLVLHKWKIRIRDRSLKFSNQVVTDSILIPRN
ncbi:hypothetical protein SAMN04487995_1612 [Dyadobacter koreensis]|uniref:Lipoprotein n=1 Tax=Dyadobacter koreensis TaxID=408657 RepID=A0A1H6S1E9_9BACT|nr:hypothetical protein [Dyadobacter koreensis]SEI60526.1 hypothetical protein SAMN04487995_1612 [Dyadobacter koreensis]